MNTEKIEKIERVQKEIKNLNQALKYLNKLSINLYNVCVAVRAIERELLDANNELQTILKESESLNE